MILSAHQNNFFPYSGVLEKVRRSDIYVALNYVQFTRGNYHNRFELDGKWYTLGVNQSLEPLANKVYADADRDWRVIKRKLPGYEDVFRLFDRCIYERLSHTNYSVFGVLCSVLDIDTVLALDWHSEKTGSERLLELCKHYGADEYLSGPSGRKYLDVDLFERNGVKVTFQEQVAPRAAIELVKERLS